MVFASSPVVCFKVGAMACIRTNIPQGTSLNKPWDVS